MRRWAGMLSMAILLGLLLWGCSGSYSQGADGPWLWFAGDTAGWSSETRAVEQLRYQGDALTVDALMDALLAGPDQESRLVSPIPSGTRLLRWRLEETGVVWVDLSAEYGNLTGIDLTLADYCITLTLTQLEGIHGVVISVNGNELSYRDRQTLYPEDVMFSGAEEEPVEVSAALYFRRRDGDTLGFEQRSFRLTESESPALAVLQALVDGPEDQGLSALLPEGLEIYSVRMEGSICVVDLSPDFFAAAPYDPREQVLVLYSIVNTLCSLDQVEGVLLTAEGAEQDLYGQQDISQALAADDRLTG